jgi:hypothetical protein
MSSNRRLEERQCLMYRRVFFLLSAAPEQLHHPSMLFHPFHRDHV